MSDIPNPKISADLKELSARVRRQDEDRWLASRYAAPDVMDRVIITLAFIIEMERTLTMSEPMIGRIRVQWWREALDEIFDQEKDVRAHELTLAIADRLSDRPDLKEQFEKTMTAYEDVLDGAENAEYPPRIETGAQTANLVAKVIDRDSPADEIEAVAQCGRAYVSARMGSPCAAPRIKLAKTAFRTVSSDFMAAIAHAALSDTYVQSPTPGPLLKRWKIFKAVLTGKI